MVLNHLFSVPGQLRYPHLSYCHIFGQTVLLQAYAILGPTGTIS